MAWLTLRGEDMNCSCCGKVSGSLESIRQEYKNLGFAFCGFCIRSSRAYIWAEEEIERRGIRKMEELAIKVRLEKYTEFIDEVNIEVIAKRLREYTEGDMPAEVRDFWKRHPELILIGVTTHPMAWPVYNFMATDGVRVNVSLDYGGYRHISFTKRQPPLFRPDIKSAASEQEMARYLDFFEGKESVRKPSPLSTATVHFYDVGHPESTKGG